MTKKIITLAFIFNNLIASNSSDYSAQSSTNQVGPLSNYSSSVSVPGIYVSLPDMIPEDVSLHNANGDVNNFNNYQSHLNSIPYEKLNFNSTMSIDEIRDKILLGQDWYNRILLLKETFPEVDKTEEFFRLEKILFNLHDHLDGMKK